MFAFVIYKRKVCNSCEEGCVRFDSSSSQMKMKAVVNDMRLEQNKSGDSVNIF